MLCFLYIDLSEKKSKFLICHLKIKLALYYFYAFYALLTFNYVT